MTDALPRFPAIALLLLLAGAGAAALVGALWGLHALMLGWLAAWLWALSLAVGAAGWLLIGALTGGRWCAAAAPVLAPLAASTWIAALAGALLAVAGPMLYPWWGQDTAPTLWLAPGVFGLRSALVLGLWSVMGLLASRGVSPVVAAAILTLHGVAVTIAGADWILSLDPAFGSTAFGAHLGVVQLALALALLAVAAPQGGDIGGLMLACVLGVFYLAAMEYLVSWSGNLPHKAAWYLARQAGGGALLWLSFGLGILLPFAVLLRSRWRQSAAARRAVGAMMLAAGLVHFVWLVAPGHFAAAGLAALAIAMIAATGAALMGRARR